MISEVFINEQIADLYEEETILLTLAVADVKEPESKNSTRSKTVTFPGSDRNNIIFRHIFNVQVDNTFNPNAKSSCLILQGGIQVFSGDLQLLRINVLDGHQVEYETHMFSDNQGIFSDMGDNLMTGNIDTNGDADTDKDLDLSAQDHPWTEPIQRLTWLGGGNYVYPLIDYGYTADGITYDATYLFPAVKLKFLIDKIFAKYNKFYTSAFFNSAFFANLYIPFSRGQVPPLTSAQLAQKEAMASAATYYDAQANTTVIYDCPFDDDSTPPNHDAGGNFNTSTFKFTCPTTAEYLVGGEILVRFRYHATANVTSVLPHAAIGIAVKKGATTIISNVATSAPAFTLTSGNDYNDDFVLPFEVDAHTLNAGDEIKVVVTGTYTTPIANLELYIGTRIGSFISVKRKYPIIGYGDTFPGNQMLPIKVKQREFLSSVLRMFNLYVDEDKDNSGYLLIEPRDDYYNLGTILNWEDKLDRSQKVLIQPMSELDFKELRFKYKEDGDYWNKLYFDEFSEPYGTQKVYMNTDFVKATKDVEVIFSPTPLVQQSALSAPVVPAIYSQDTTGVKKLLNTNIRVLYYGGMKTKAWVYTYNGGSSNEAQYPYIGHLDDPYSATLDLGFGAPKKIYYFSTGDIELTNNTLYGGYYRNYVTEITHINSKLLTAWFRLTEKDIQTLRLFDTIYVLGAQWRINKIIDYNATGNDLTQVELLFQIDSPTFTPTQTVIDGTGEDQIDGNGTAIFPYGGYMGTPNGNSERRTVYGRNYVANDARNVIVNGDGDNVVGMGAYTVNLSGCSNCIVGPGCYNITMMNCTGITIPDGYHDIVCIACTAIEGDIESDAVYINNQIQ